MLSRGGLWRVVTCLTVTTDLKFSVTLQDLTVTWRLRCLGSQPSAGLRPSACGFLTSQRPLRTNLRRACWWDAWMAPSAGCKSPCRRSTCMWRALNSPTATGKKVRRWKRRTLPGITACFRLCSHRGRLYTKSVTRKEYLTLDRTIFLIFNLLIFNVATVNC